MARHRKRFWEQRENETYYQHAQRIDKIRSFVLIPLQILIFPVALLYRLFMWTYTY